MNSALDPRRPPPIFVINLEGSPERYESAVKQLARADVHPRRFSGVDGRTLSRQQIQELYDEQRNRRHYRRPLSVGEIGCYSSHQALWKMVLEEQHEYAVILEDDFEAQPHLRGVLAQLRRLGNWDLIKLFDNCDTPGHSALPLGDGYRLEGFTKVPNCATAYAISRSGARKLLKRRRFFRPVDVDMQLHHELDLSVLAITPYAIWPAPRFQSEIEAMNGGTRKGKTTILRNARYRLSLAWHRKRYPSADLSRISLEPDSVLELSAGQRGSNGWRGSC